MIMNLKALYPKGHRNKIVEWPRYNDDWPYGMANPIMECMSALMKKDRKKFQNQNINRPVHKYGVYYAHTHYSCNCYDVNAS